jgi:uncharacterized cupin superfamily protein
MKQKAAVIRIDTNLDMSSWEPMTLVGELADGQLPMERFHRVQETLLSAPCKVRAGLWEAQAYSERLEDYPYDEIVFVVEGSISIVDEDGNDERFEAGDCFFLQRGFNGYWNQLQTLKIFHMTVAPQ